MDDDDDDDDEEGGLQQKFNDCDHRKDIVLWL